MAVIQEAWIAGVSTRRVDELVQAMGMTGISKSSVSKLCKDSNERVNAFLKRPLDGEWPYLWLGSSPKRTTTASPAAGLAVANLACAFHRLLLDLDQCWSVDGRTRCGVTHPPWRLLPSRFRVHNTTSRVPGFDEGPSRRSSQADPERIGSRL